MKNNIWLLTLGLFSLTFFVPYDAFAQEPEFWTRYTTTKECGRYSVYVGPNAAHEHGGVCLFFSEGVELLHSSYTTTKNCPEGGFYAGPNRPDLHGGTCLWILDNDYVLFENSTRSQYSCGRNETYVGPNRPDLHGGTCLGVFER